MPLSDAPLYNKQHAVPQNIMDVEFKIIGELTLRQFAYLIIFGGVAYISAVYMRGMFRWPVTLLSAMLGFGLAFVPLEERGLDQWIVNFFMAVYTPSQKIWRKAPITPAVFLYQNMAVVKQELITLAPTSSRRKLEEFLEFQDTAKKEDALDIPEDRYIRMAKEAFGEVSAPTEAATAQVISEPAPELEERSELQTKTMPPKQPEAVPITPHQVKDSEQPKQEEFKHEETPKPQPISPTPTPQPRQEDEIVKTQSPKQEPQIVSRVAQPVASPAPPKSHKLYQPRPDSKPKSYISSPMTPDRHSGRRFTSLLPKQGEIILPIRGERVLKTSEEVDVENEMKEKTEQLNKLISQIRKSHEYKHVGLPPKSVKEEPVAAKPQPAPPPKPQPTKEELEQKKLVEEVQRLREEVRKSREARERFIPPTPEPKPQSEQHTIPLPIQEKEKPQEPIPDTAFRPTKSILVTPNTPNTISGLVKSDRGTALPGTVIIVKNDMGKTVRALKANSLGQFTLVSPLTSGSYTIEIDPFHKSGYLFDIISTEVQGDIVPPFEISGRPANAK